MINMLEIFCTNQRDKRAQLASTLRSESSLKKRTLIEVFTQLLERHHP
jgi:hypothetical protein